MKKEYVFPANDLVYDKKIETDDDLKDYIKHLEHNLYPFSWSKECGDLIF